MSKIRLDKLISNQISISRKDTKSGLRNGLATVNGKVIKSADYQVDTDTDKVVFDGQAVVYKEFIYIVMNKPKGVLSATEDKFGRTVIDIIPDSLKRNGLFPVGRLDKDTTGLLIITDDGDFAHRILAPQKNIYKTYIATLDGEITDKVLEIFKNEITLADGTVCRRAHLKKLDTYRAEVKICEGRYHQIKRMFGVAGLGVNELERTQIGEYALPEDLSIGDCRETTKYSLSSVFLGNITIKDT